MEEVITSHPADVCRPPLTEVALCAWVGQALPGDRLAYHAGYLAIDKEADSRFATPAERQELRRVADRAWQLAQDGIVHLVQRRDGEADFIYYVVVRRRRRATSGALRAVLEQAGLSDLRRSA